MPQFAFYAASMAGAATLAGLLLRRYADPRRVTLVVLAVAWYAWLVSLSVVALVPVDVYTTLTGAGDVAAIAALWKVSYWSTQALTWAVIPVIQGYVLSGAFTAAGRLRSALRRLWRFWLVVGALAALGIALAAAWGKLRLSTLPQLIVLLSNTYGLVAVVALLGYGLVEVPRVLWRRSFPETRLTWHLHRLGRAAARLEDAAGELERAMAVALITQQAVPRAAGELRAKADGLVAYLDAHSPVPVAALAASKVDVEALEERDLEYSADAAGLARLRGRLKLAIAEFVGSRGDYLSYLAKALELEAVCKSRQHGLYSPPSEGGGAAAGWRPAAAWWYKCVARPHVQRLSSLVLAAASAVIVWCEATIGTGRHPDLSPLSLAVHAPAVLASAWGAQLVVALPLAYACAAAYFSLFKLGSLGPYHMVPGSTWSWSLLLNGSLLARFAAPLAFNYLHVIRMTGGQAGGRRTAFVGLMRLEDVPLLGAGFNTWFPLVMVAYVIVLTTDVCGACASRVCNSAPVKMILPARMRIQGERPDAESVARGRALLAAEHEAAAAGGEAGEGTGLFGMVRSAVPEGGGAAVAAGGFTRLAGGAGSSGGGGRPGAPESGSGGVSGYRARKEVELGVAGGAAAGATAAATARQPLFGTGPRSDSPGGGHSSPPAPDAVDHLFAGVGRAGRARGRNGAWDD